MHGPADHPATGRRNGKSSDPRVRVSCPGLDRITWVRVLVVDGRPVSCDVHGTRHRRPIVVPVPYATARTLIDAGIPAVVREQVVA